MKKIIRILSAVILFGSTSSSIMAMKNIETRQTRNKRETEVNNNEETKNAKVKRKAQSSKGTTKLATKIVLKMTPKLKPKLKSQSSSSHKKTKQIINSGARRRLKINETTSPSLQSKDSDASSPSSGPSGPSKQPKPLKVRGKSRPRIEDNEEKITNNRQEDDIEDDDTFIYHSKNDILKPLHKIVTLNGLGDLNLKDNIEYKGEINLDLKKQKLIFSGNNI